MASSRERASRHFQRTRRPRQLLQPHRFVLLSCLVLLFGTDRASAINIVFERLSESTHPLILDGTASFTENNPSFDSNAAGLTSILQHVKSVYEDAFEDTATIHITYWWDANMSCCGQSIPAMIFEEPEGTLTHSIVRFFSDADYFIDTTPWNDSEFEMDQVLYNFGPNSLTPTQQTARFTGNVPDVFEAGYKGAAIDDGPADGLIDLLSLAFHEVGHSLGMNAGFSGLQDQIDNGQFDVDPNFVNGAVMGMLPRGVSPDPLDHLAGNDAVLGSGCCSGRRTRPSAADYFAIASTQGWTMVDLPRQDFLSGNDWHVGSNWLGATVPGSPNEAYVRHGGPVTLSGFVNVFRLLVDNDSTVSTSTNTLVANLVDLQKTAGTGTPRLLVGNGGTLRSDIITIDDGARLDVFGGETEAPQYHILPGGELRGNGTIDITGLFGQLVNDGTIRASGVGTLVLTALPNNTTALNLSGNSGNGQVIATVADIHVQAAMGAPFTGGMTIGAARQITFDSSLSLGAGGLMVLDGSAANAATVNGAGLLFVGGSGTLRADGFGVVENVLVMEPSSFAESANFLSELRLQNTTFLRGGGFFGPGTIRQNGDLFVEQNSQVQVARYHLSGQAGNTVVTVDPNVTFTIASPQIAPSPINDFTGTIHLNGGTLDMVPNWRLDGTMNFNEAGDTTPRLMGAGGVILSPSGEMHVMGSGRIDPAISVEGTVMVGDPFTTTSLDFHGQTFVFPSATFDVDALGSFVSFHGHTVLAGGSYVGIGGISFENTVNVIANTTIGTMETDLDGEGESAEITIQPDILFSIASTTIEPSGRDDGFDGVITNHGTFNVLPSWRLDGQLHMQQVPARGIPTLNGTGLFHNRITGNMTVAGNAEVNPPMQVSGALSVAGGVTNVNNVAGFDATANVTVASDAELVLNGEVMLAGGSYIGGGVMQFNAPTAVVAPTTIGVARLDIDGASHDNHWTLDNSPLVLNAERINLTNNIFSGEMDINGNDARLTVNLTNPAAAVWQLGSNGVLNFNVGGAATPTVLAGSPVIVHGRINADGRARVEAITAIRGRLQLADADTRVHFGGGGPHLIHNTAILDGPGGIIIDHGTEMFLENNAIVGVDVHNDGRLGVGFHAGDLGVDFTAPGQATIRGVLSQSSTGLFAVQVGGLLPQQEHDVLDVIGTANLGGTLEVELIDGFVPQIGDEVTILTALSVVDQFENVMAFDAAQQVTVDVSVIYSPTDVTVRFGAIGLAGDFNGDGQVDGDDLTDPDLGWNVRFGDDLDGFDFLVWQKNFGAGIPLSASEMVPEPSALLLVLISLGGITCRRKGGHSTFSREASGR